MKRSHFFKFYILFLLAVVLIGSNAKAQNTRLNSYGSVGWYNYFGTFKVSGKVGFHTEYQWRRDNFIAKWQQGLLRVGLNYQFNPRIVGRFGYAWAETFSYGDIPINGLGRSFTEHRIFQMLQLSQKEGIVELSHRFMLEQRFVGRYSSSAVEREDEFPLLNRMRYMLRLQVPLKGSEVMDKTPYLAIYDEVFIGFGKNVTANVFDQNRIAVLLGFRYNKNVRIEAGYLNQTIQFGRQIGGRNVFQTNNGFFVNANFNFDLRKSQE